MRQKLRSITQSLRLPAICILCKQYHKSALAVCLECQHCLPSISQACIYCARPLYEMTYPICGVCIKDPPHVDKAIIGHTFEEPLRSLLHDFKYNKGLYLSSFLSGLMIDTWEKNVIETDCLIPVPMHPKKLKARGFNQAVVLTKHLAKYTNLPYDIRSCQKIINTSAQADLDEEKRKTNLRNAFQIKALTYQKVTLIDDLFTTGSTANELAQALKRAGATTVYIWCCARAVTRF